MKTSKRKKAVPLGQKDYRDYINSKAWKIKRLERIKLDGYRCQICGTTRRLNVHHLTYIRLGCEDLDDLITLCESCHERVHEEMRREKK